LQRVQGYNEDAMKLMITGTPQLIEKQWPTLSHLMTKASKTISEEAGKVLE
jgi:hypothetical protein